MAPNSLPLLIVLIASTVSVSGTSTVAKDGTVPCTMCAECENPCQPLPPPPPPPAIIECPPPPSPSPPPPLPPPPPPLPSTVVECPPPPKPSCPGNCEQPPTTPQGPPGSLYPPGYYPPYFPVPHNNDYGSCGKTVPFSGTLIYAFFLCLPYYLFI